MTRLVSVDPGINGCAWAVWVGGTLRACGIARVKHVKDAILSKRILLAVEELSRYLHKEDTIVIEFPQVYRENKRGSKSKADPNDLLPLAAIAGGLSCLMPSVITYLPCEWKGRLPKAESGQDYIVDTRIKDRLQGLELAAYTLGMGSVPVSLQHNISDAVGIGLHHLNRFERKRVYPR